MIHTFACRKTKELHVNAIAHRQFRAFALAAKRKLMMLHAATNIMDLRTPPSNRLEKLSGNRAGQYSIRINAQWRICFRWNEKDAYDVEICDYH